MASRISQMRNGMAAAPQPQQQPPQASNQMIEQMRRMMWMVKGAKNPQVGLTQLLQNNPNTAAISQMLRGGNDLESIARQMAQQRGIEIDEVINQIGGM